jgi:hypothetical protein
MLGIILLVKATNLRFKTLKILEKYAPKKDWKTLKSNPIMKLLLYKNILLKQGLNLKMHLLLLWDMITIVIEIQDVLKSIYH